ncbi:MAG: DUF1850 domain-containing protein [Ruminococcaceae bacterium]|nr:DUF1850 domain-containing protein [Oscillospiraceae bacterium]
MKRSILTAVVFVIAAVMVCLGACDDGGLKLALCYQQTDEVIKTFDVEEGSTFSVEFIHSVNKSPVKDVFVIRNGKIYADKTIYSAFGAGVQTEVEEGQTLTYDENNNMVVSGFDIEFPKVKCIVGTVSDHILEIGEESISLTELCGKNAKVYFELR